MAGGDDDGDGDDSTMNVGRQVVAARATTMPFPARSSDDDEDDGRRENEAAEEATPRMMVGEAVRRRGRWRMVTSMIIIDSR